MNTSTKDILSPRAFTEIQASHYIGMSRSFLARARMDGHRKNHTQGPPFLKIGRTVRYLRDDLDQWLNQQQRLEFLDQAV